MDFLLTVYFIISILVLCFVLAKINYRYCEEDFKLTKRTYFNAVLFAILWPLGTWVYFPTK